MKPEVDDAFLERFKETVDQAGGPRAVARGADIPERTVHNYLAGERAPGLAALKKVAVFTQVDLNWLITGQSAAPQRQTQKDFNTELMARIVDGFMKLYKELRIPPVPAELGRKYAEVHADIVAATGDPEEQFAMVKLAVAQHRKALAAPPSAETIGKQRA